MAKEWLKKINEREWKKRKNLEEIRRAGGWNAWLGLEVMRKC